MRGSEVCAKTEDRRQNYNPEHRLRAEPPSRTVKHLQLGRKGFGVSGAPGGSHTCCGLAQICGRNCGPLHTCTHTHTLSDPGFLPGSAPVMRTALNVVLALPWATAESFCVLHTASSRLAICRRVHPHTSLRRGWLCRHPCAAEETAKTHVANGHERNA